MDKYVCLGQLQPSHFRLLGVDARVVKAKVRRRRSDSAKIRRQRCEGESAKAKKRHYYRSFAFATSLSGLRIFVLSPSPFYN